MATKCFVHRLVAAAFLGPCPVTHEVNHKDRNRSNPRLENLEYLTRSENLKHAMANGAHRCRGINKPGRKLNEIAILGILRSQDSLRKLAAKYGVSSVTILKIKRREKWKHVHAN
jgi:hypothetical protein